MSSSPPSPDSPARWSDKENGRRLLVMRDKGARAAESSKRKRALTNGTERANSRRRTEELSEEPSGSEEDANQSDQYDPDQPIEERREVQRGLRKLREDARINRDRYMQPGEGGVRRLIKKANALSGNVKQTAEATIDSRLLVETVELSYKKTALLTSGDAGQGVDVDSFVTQCLRYMRLGAGIADDQAPELTSTQRQRRQPTGRGRQRDSDDEDDIGDDGDLCNWEHLGRYVGVPNVRRPAASSFLLGPLSVEKKVRKITKRSAPFRPNSLRETRPEVLDASAIQRKEDNDLTAICHKIFQRLKTAQAHAQDAAEAAYNDGGEENAQEVMEQTGLRSTGGMDFFKCIINPDSYGQTVENMFYVSFLIRDNQVQLELDEDGHPTLAPVEEPDRHEAGSRHGSQKHQAIFHLDKAQYHAIIKAYDIKESIIENRQQQASAGPGARGWYN
ncbi:putative Nse4 C-terminal-domain-containing protein [Seiridium cardinale]